ncbi:hypothetical protein BKA83DRAFT_4499055 [Pisolithus microcarpus]|nr:hypothetical protein BKA83DRAFT_4499055 [Pisolithus microcarpus]
MFGSVHSKSDLHFSPLLSPISKKGQGHARKWSSLVPIQDQSGSLPIPPEARGNLGLTGTMGSYLCSMVVQEFDVSNPDSDIPDKLQVILSDSDQELDVTMSVNPNVPPSTIILPPKIPLPVPEARALSSSEEDTKKSFDFTREINKFNKSSALHQHSFVEQLESTLHTPAKIDLHSVFGNFFR